VKVETWAEVNCLWPAPSQRLTGATPSTAPKP
jgi:hypothetical protein